MKRQPFRLVSGGRIDRERPLRFAFDGRDYVGYEGDTLASALLANGVRTVGRSFRLHRPRGIMSAGAEEANAIMQLGRGATTEPNLKATQIALFDGLDARAVNAWPSARFDISAVLGLFQRFLKPGFYYKTFIWPYWNLYSWLIRRLGGMGIAPPLADPDRYETRFDHCDVLVVGGGPAGMSAARAAAESGAHVVLVDDQRELGGSLLGMREEVAGQPALDWIADAGAQLHALGVRVFTETMAVGWYDHNLIALNQQVNAPGGIRQRFLKMRARHVVLASGAIERPLVFPANDRPNIMLAGAARAYAVRFGVAAGWRAAIATNNDSAYEAAFDLLDAGITISAFADLRDRVRPDLIARLRAKGVEPLLSCGPVDTKGDPEIQAVHLAPVDRNGRADLSRGKWHDCDLLCVSGGWSPTLHLFSQSGGRLKFDDQRRCFLADAWVQQGGVAGAAAGEFSTLEAIAGGRTVGAVAAGEPVPAAKPADTPAEAPSTLSDSCAWEVIGDGRRPAWVDHQYDVTSSDVRIAAAENYRSVEHLKRYTTLGMALDQGKTSNVNGIGVLAAALVKPIADVGTTRFRPPYSPVTLGAIVGHRTGRRLLPLRQLPTHAEQEKHGATMEDYGGWLRPAFYAAGGESEEDAIRREALHVRNAVGLFDASPLGKLLVSGPDAAKFLDRMYINTISTIKVGKCRYALLLNEHGAIRDDGVIQRLADDEFLVGTTSGFATEAGYWFEDWLQCEWPDLDVIVQPVTNQWATINLAGPNALALLRALEPSVNVDDSELPHMSLANATIGRANVRIARVSYSGERSYEISIAANRGAALWRQCLDVGAGFGVAPFGVEALMRLRLEKGFLHVGADTDSDTYPQDIGFGRVMFAKKNDFVGRRSTMRVNANDRRKQLVGIQALSVSDAFVTGSHIIAEGGTHSQGWISSSGFSPVLGRYVALGRVECGVSRHGEDVIVFNQGRRIRARLCSPCAFDPDGTRLHV